MSPFFNPGPNQDADVPIYISAVNKYNCRLVGELCDGIRMHGFNTMKYTKEVIIPAIEEGAKKAGRKLEDIDLVGGSFVIAGKTEEEVEKAKAPVRQQLSFYASTGRTTRSWRSTAGRKRARDSSASRWKGNGQRWPRGSQTRCSEFAVIGTYDQLVSKLKARYSGVVTTLDFGFGIRSPEQAEILAALVQDLKNV